MAFVAASILPFSSCSDFLDREPITKPEAGNFLTGAIQVENYINGLYMTLPSFSKFGLDNAPAAVLEMERKKQADAESIIKSLKESNCSIEKGITVHHT